MTFAVTPAAGEARAVLVHGDVRRRLQKPGVGLLLDTGRSLQLRRVVVTTDTPGYTALIEAGSARGGPFRSVSAAAVVAARKIFAVHSAARRYYVVWITKLAAPPVHQCLRISNPGLMACRAPFSAGSRHVVTTIVRCLGLRL